MSKSQTPEQPQPQPEETVAAASRKRQFTAVAAATTVNVVLGVAANVLIGKVAAQVSDRINPQPKIESTN